MAEAQEAQTYRCADPTCDFKADHPGAVGRHYDAVPAHRPAKAGISKVRAEHNGPDEISVSGRLGSVRNRLDEMAVKANSVNRRIDLARRLLPKGSGRATLDNGTAADIGDLLRSVERTTDALHDEVLDILTS